MDQCNRIGHSEINPHTYGQLIFDKGNKNTQWGKDRLSASGAGKAEQTCQSVRSEHTFTPHTKTNSEWGKS